MFLKSWIQSCLNLTVISPDEVLIGFDVKLFFDPCQPIKNLYVTEIDVVNSANKHFLKFVNQCAT